MRQDDGDAIPVHQTKREVAEARIRNAIETGRYQPGQVISQRRLVEDLGLSVTPIREAILVLSSTGIVERHSHHSIKVSEISPDRLRQIFRVRRLLEEDAIGLAAQRATAPLIERLTRLNAELIELVADPQTAEVNRIDRAFHTEIFRASDNDALVWSIDKVKSSFPMYALWLEPGRLATSVTEHQQLIEALASRDPARCVAAQRAHLANGLEATIDYLVRALGHAE